MTIFLLNNPLLAVYTGIVYTEFVFITHDRGKMLKNITLSAEDHLIRKARKKSKSDHTTLNAQFRQWLEKYTSLESNSNNFEILMEKLNYAQPNQYFNRDEMNER